MSPALSRPSLRRALATVVTSALLAAGMVVGATPASADELTAPDPVVVAPVETAPATEEAAPAPETVPQEPAPVPDAVVVPDTQTPAVPAPTSPSNTPVAPAPVAPVADTGVAAAAPTVTVTPATGIDPSIENTFTVTGTGFTGPAAVFGAYVVLGDSTIWSGDGPLVADGWLELAWVMPRQIIDGVFSTTVTIAANSFVAGVDYQVATSAAHGLSATNRSLDTFTTLEVSFPTVTVTPTTNIDPTVENTFTVSGTGFFGAGAVSGAYVLLGDAAIWSGDGPAVAKGWLALAWVRTIEKGAFTTTLTVPAGSFVAGVDYQVATSAAHGLSVTNRTLDTFTTLEVSFPTVTVTPATGIDPTIENTFTVTGSGFRGAAAASGAYVVLGDATVWSGDGPLVSAGWLKMAWVMPRQIIDGAFTVTVKIPAHAFLPGVGYQVATSAAHSLSATNRSLDTFTPLGIGDAPAAGATSTTLTASAGTVTEGQSVTFTASVTPSTVAGTVRLYEGLTPVGTAATVANGRVTIDAGLLSVGTHVIHARFAPADPALAAPSLSSSVSVVVAPVVVEAPAAVPTTTGSLSWSISRSFAAYIVSPIAHGAITTSGGATAANGIYQFGQAAGGTYSAATGTGTVNYAGSVRFFGHNGILDLTFANPVIDIRGSQGTMHLTVNGRQIAFATVSGLGAPATANGGVTYNGATLTLTSAGAGVFDGYPFTPDPIAFTVGVAGAAPAGSSGAVAYAAATPSAAEIALSVTERTVELTAASCTVQSATLDWGFKESFRNYIESIAHGTWEVGNGAAYSYPNYSFTGTAGGYDTATASGVATLAGSVRFTGHDGVLDTTISNPQVELVDASTGYLLFDVAGETRDGEPIAVTGIRFAALDLSAGTLESTEAGITATAVPATLTEDGAAAFGTYPAGEELDDVSFALTLAPECANPVAAVSSDASEDATVKAAPRADVAVDSDAANLGWVAWAVGIMVLLGAAIAVGATVMKRRPAGK